MAIAIQTLVCLILNKKRQTATEEYIVYTGMPHDQSHTSLMCHQINDRLLQISQQSAIGNLPDLDSAVLRATGNDVVVVRTPLDV